MQSAKEKVMALVKKYKFNWVNTPRKSWRPWKKYAVLAKQWDDVKVVHFWATWYQDYLQHKDSNRRANFKSRMNCSSEKNKLTPKRWACNFNR
jgi:hypothetical protein